MLEGDILETNSDKSYKISDIKKEIIDELMKENQEEQNYLDMLDFILKEGVKKKDRTGIGTLSIFGHQLRFDLKEHFPLLTTKKIWLKGIFHELQWILSGSTNNKDLKNNKVHIWDGNSTREFLDTRGLHHYVEDDIGATYGYACRHYGHKEYKGCQEDYKGLGFDQLEYVINELKTNPSSRRILINLWDPSMMDQVALMPCFFIYNFYVDTENKKLNLSGYIRSSDSLLGLPWNIGYAALMVHLLCNIKGIDLEPGELLINTCDQHIYLNHIEAVKEQISRKPTEFPKLQINRKVDKIEDYNWNDISLLNYNPMSNIKAPMAI